MHGLHRLGDGLHLQDILRNSGLENPQALLISLQVLSLYLVVGLEAAALVGFGHADDAEYFLHFIGVAIQQILIVILVYQRWRCRVGINLSQQSKMDVLTLVVTIIGSIISLLVDIYFIILYTHKQQPMCKPLSVICKILILITLLQVELQPLFLLFDVNSSRNSGSNFTILWFAVYFSILANIAFLKPIASSLYEADEEDSCWKIVLWTIVEVIITMAVFGVFLGIGWLFWGKVFIPFQEITVTDLYTQGGQITQATTSTSIQIVTTVPCFLIGLLCLIGYPILACCGAFGMTALPFSLIMDFKNRPKWRRTNEAKAITDQLKKQTVALIKQADRVKRCLNRVQYIDGWFSKRKKNQELETQLSQLEIKLQKHRDFYELFRLELDMANVNPWVFIFKLIGAILCLIFTPLWLVQILLGQLVFQKSVFLDKFLVFMEEQNASFISVAFILLLTLYMILSTLKGIFFISQSLPFIKIHPMVEGKTWLNSFMFQTNIAVLASTAIVHLMVTTFPEYLRGGDIALMMGAILQGMLFTGVFIRNKVFIYIFLIMSVLGSFFVAFRMFCLNHKSEQMLRIQQIRKKLFGKDKKNQKMTIEMTEMNLKDKDEGSKKKKKDEKTKNKGVKVSQSNIPSKSNITSNSNISSKKRVKLQFM